MVGLTPLELKDAMAGSASGFVPDNEAVCPARETAPLSLVAHDSEVSILCRYGECSKLVCNTFLEG